MRARVAAPRAVSRRGGVDASAFRSPDPIARKATKLDLTVQFSFAIVWTNQYNKQKVLRMSSLPEGRHGRGGTDSRRSTRGQVSAGEQTHPVHRVHRLGAAVLGAGLVVFAVLGLVNRPAFFSRDGEQVMGLSSNGALSVISLAMGTCLLLAATRSGRLSSTTTLTAGALFLLSGFVHLAIIDTAANVLSFRLPNVFFSFAAGVLLLALGAYGRFSGGLAPDNPYARTGSSARSTTADHPVDRAEQHLTRAELNANAGHATVEQHAQLHADATRRAAEQHDRAWQDFAATHTEDEVARMRAVSAAESASTGSATTRER